MGREALLKKLESLRVRMLGSPLWVAMLFLPFFRPSGLTGAAHAVEWLFFQSGSLEDVAYVLDCLLTVWKGLSMLCILAFFLARPKLSRVTLLAGVYQIVLLVSTAVNGISLSQAVFQTASVVMLCAALDLCVAADVRALMKGLFWLLGVECIINLGTVLFFSGAFKEGRIYFWGYDNIQMFYILPLLGVTMINIYDRRRGLLCKICFLALFSASVFITWSVTGMIGMVVFIFLMLIYEIRPCRRVINAATCYAVFLALFLVVVVFRMQDSFAPIIEGLLKKDLTLTGRTAVWDRAFAAIALKPLLGHGALTQAAASEILGVYFCHNLLVQKLFDTGVVGLAVYLGILALLVKPLMRERKSYVGYVLTALVFSFLIISIVESPTGAIQLYGVYVLAYHAPEIAAALDGQRDGSLSPAAES